MNELFTGDIYHRSVCEAAEKESYKKATICRVTKIFVFRFSHSFHKIFAVWFLNSTNGSNHGNSFG